MRLAQRYQGGLLKCILITMYVNACLKTFFLYDESNIQYFLRITHN